MPIELEFPVVRILQDAFHVIDEVFTGLVFQTHKELGRLCDEKVYQNGVHPWINFNHHQIEFRTISRARR